MLDIETKNNKLQHLLGIENTDLRQNQQQQLGENQRRQLDRQRQQMWRGLATLYIIPMLIVLVMAIVLNDSVARIFIMVLVVGWTVGFGRSILRIRQQQRVVEDDIASNNLQFAEGRIWRDKRGDNAFYIGIGEQEFLVQEALYELISEDEVVAICYLGNSGKLLSIEYIQAPFIEENMTL